MKMKLPLLLLIVLSIVFFDVQAQVQTNMADSFILKADSPKPVFPSFKVAIFSPLYLDSAFLGDSYRYNKSFPALPCRVLNLYKVFNWRWIV